MSVKGFSDANLLEAVPSPLDTTAARPPQGLGINTLCMEGCPHQMATRRPSLATLPNVTASVPVPSSAFPGSILPLCTGRDNIVHILFILFAVCLTPLPGRVQVTRNFPLFCSLPYFQHLEQCLEGRGTSQCSSRVNLKAVADLRARQPGWTLLPSTCCLCDSHAI